MVRARLSRWGLAAGLATAGIASFGHLASAQFAPPPPPTTPQPLYEFGQVLKNNGIFLQALDVNNFAAVVGGGRSHDQAFNGELLFGSTLDLDTIAGLKGSSFHVNLDYRYGHGITNSVGMLQSLEADVGPQETIRLSGLYWEQTLLDNRLNIVAGRTSPNFDFDVASFGCEFLNSTTCTEANAWLYNTDVIPYPASTWGTRINYDFDHHIYFRTGAFQEQALQLDNGQHGFTFGIENSTGVAVPIELGYQTTLFNADYPSKYALGGIIDTGGYFNPYDSPPKFRSGRGSIYGVLEQTVWRPYSHSPQFLTLFGGFWVGTGGFQLYNHQIYAGAFARGPFQFRPYDSIGFLAGYVSFDKYSTAAYPAETILEANYGINLMSGVTLKPYIKYVIHPDQIGYEPRRHIADATIVGIQLNINANAALGLPYFLPH